jgi:hypothetical protein
MYFFRFRKKDGHLRECISVDAQNNVTMDQARGTGKANFWFYFILISLVNILPFLSLSLPSIPNVLSLVYVEDLFHVRDAGHSWTSAGIILLGVF